MEKMPWVYLSESPVPVVSCIEIPDVYQQLLRYEQDGLLVIRRWSEASPEQKQCWEAIVKRSLADQDLTSPLSREYCQFIESHFPNIG